MLADPVTRPGFAVQRSGTTSVGVHHEINMFSVSISTPSFDTIDVQTTSDTRPPSVKGRFTTCFENGCDVGLVRGEVQRSGPSILTLAFPEQQRGVISNRPNPRDQLAVVLERGQPDVLLGQYQYGRSMVRVPTIYIRAIHVGPNPPDIQQSAYVYGWTPTLPKDAFNGSALNLGHLEVDRCEHVLLSSETTATASCQTHVKLTPFAAAVCGDGSTDQTMQASFGKQPDGTWVATNMVYSPPQYAGVWAGAASTRDEKVPEVQSNPPPNASRSNLPPSTGADSNFVLLAEINDPDGYTNVRASQSPSSAILAVVRVGEEFRTFQQTGGWWKVKTRAGIVGYMYASRIRLRR